MVENGRYYADYILATSINDVGLYYDISSDVFGGY